MDAIAPFSYRGAETPQASQEEAVSALEDGRAYLIQTLVESASSYDEAAKRRGWLERIEWAALAADLGTTEGALRVAVHRLRKRFRERLEAEVRDTLTDHDMDGDELAELLAALQA